MREQRIMWSEKKNGHNYYNKITEKHGDTFSLRIISPIHVSYQISRWTLINVSSCDKYGSCDKYSCAFKKQLVKVT